MILRGVLAAGNGADCQKRSQDQRETHARDRPFGAAAPHRVAPCNPGVGVPAGVSLQELVTGMNALGVSPRDLISILQAIKAAGSLHAEIVVM